MRVKHKSQVSRCKCLTNLHVLFKVLYNMLVFIIMQQRLQSLGLKLSNFRSTFWCLFVSVSHFPDWKEQIRSGIMVSFLLKSKEQYWLSPMSEFANFVMQKGRINFYSQKLAGLSAILEVTVLRRQKQSMNLCSQRQTFCTILPLYRTP